MSITANPESGTIQYGYDPNGNLTTKTDARSITTTYAYDALNRVTQRSYSDATPAVSYFYDNLTNAKGRLTKVTSSVSTTENTSFDILGRVTGHKQTTDGQEYATGYLYNLSGALVEQVYPSGRVVKNVLDANGDLSMVQSKKNSAAGFWNYAENFTYNAAGAVTSMQLGNGKWESTQFNSRLQPTQIGLGSTLGATNLLKLDYEYGASGSVNNGNITKQTITVPTVGVNTGFTAVQNYAYDSLNRLKSAEETISSVTSWKQTFTFDRYGNRNFDEANTSFTGFEKLCNSNTELCADVRKILNPSINQSNNRLSSSDDYAFDTAGNTTNDPQGRTIIYDAENKQTEVRDQYNTVIGQYRYDGDGKRVKKIVPSTGETTVFVYDAVGKQIAEYSTVVASVEDAKVAYLTNDHLGSPRINTDREGNITARHDYHPFGEEIYTSQRTTGLSYAADTIRKQFTGYERDNETGLDFAQARFYNSSHGRFTTVDPILESISTENPQTINSYIYALNNPLAFIDPNGEEPLRVGSFDDLSDEQKRLFQTYVNSNFANQMGEMHPEDFAKQTWNDSAFLANAEGDLVITNGTALLSQSQLTTFLGVTSMLEAQGVIGEVATISTINGDQKDDNFRILGELKGKDSASKIFAAFPNGIGGTDKKPYVVSRREGSLRQQPNGQVTLTEDLIGINSDVDYRRLTRIKAHNTKDNSDIRADDGDTSHYRRHVGRYGPIRALTPVNPTFVRSKK